jgi:hypothetical protein
MKLRSFILFLYCFILGLPHSMAAEKKLFRFGIVSQAINAKSADGGLQDELAALEAKKLAFVVANGIKAADEPCSDELYTERRNMFEHAANALIPSLTADDWTKCLNSNGKSSAAERLNRVRELFFAEKTSLGERKIPLIRQSITPQFRSFGENSRWRYRNILFATIHLPENNNNYVSEAGRNSEFEDRLIANRDWLQKLFVIAKREKLDGVVLFSDANPIAQAARAEQSESTSVRDGFREMRQQILKQAAGFSGKVLIVHKQAPDVKPAPRTARRIRWSRNLGELGIATGAAVISVVASPALFVPEPVSIRNVSSIDGRS